MHLYFRHANKTYSIVEPNIETPDTAWIYIYRDVKKRNSDWKIKKERTWMDALNHMHFDVGSKTEEYVLM